MELNYGHHEKMLYSLTRSYILLRLNIGRRDNAEPTIAVHEDCLLKCALGSADCLMLKTHRAQSIWPDETPLGSANWFVEYCRQRVETCQTHTVVSSHAIHCETHIHIYMVWGHNKQCFAIYGPKREHSLILYTK